MGNSAPAGNRASDGRQKDRDRVRGMAKAWLALPLLAMASVPAMAQEQVKVLDRWPTNRVRPALEQDVIAEINRVRTNPRAYADDLRRYRDSFDGAVAHPDDAPDGLMTREGVAAVDEAIAAMERQPPLPPLSPARVLALGAGDLVRDQAASGRVGHYTAAGANPGDRVKARGGDIYVGEVISYGPGDAAGVVRQLIVDDGVPQRGHRLSLLSARYRYAGPACGAHARFGTMCVVDLSQTATGAPVLPAARR